MQDKIRNRNGNSRVTAEILDKVSEGIMVLDGKWTIIYLNRQASTKN